MRSGVLLGLQKDDRIYMIAQMTLPMYSSLSMCGSSNIVVSSDSTSYLYGLDHSSSECTNELILPLQFIIFVFDAPCNI